MMNILRRILTVLALLVILAFPANFAFSQEKTGDTEIMESIDDTDDTDNIDDIDETDDTDETIDTIFDDKLLLNGYTEKYTEETKEIILAMIKDDNLSPLKTAAAVRVFKNEYSTKVFSKEKRIIEKILLRRLNRTVSPFVQSEIMHTLCKMDRYRYFDAMVPALILKLDHYNETVNEIAYEGLSDIIETGNNKTREARIIFNTLRKVLFLSRRRLAKVEEPDIRLKRKLKILRWSIKVLGSQELKRLPKEVLNLL